MHILLQTIQWLCILRWFYLWVKICSSHCLSVRFFAFCVHLCIETIESNVAKTTNTMNRTEHIKPSAHQTPKTIEMFLSFQFWPLTFHKSASWIHVMDAFTSSSRSCLPMMISLFFSYVWLLAKVCGRNQFIIKIKTKGKMPTNECIILSVFMRYMMDTVDVHFLVWCHFAMTISTNWKSV